MKNEGKIFEQSFQNSIDTNRFLIKRLNDNAASFGGGQNTRFSSTNECDYIVFDSIKQKFIALELKTTLSSLTFWRKDFDDPSGKIKKNYEIKKNQIKGLDKFSKYENTVCGFVINFRKTENNNTYFVYIKNFIEYTEQLNKKSINESDVLQMNPIIIESQKKVVNYRYDFNSFIEQIK